MLMRATFSILALGLALAAPSAQAARTFCCTDELGKRVCGDVLPEACARKEYSEFNERGIKGPHHDAPLTEAQQVARDMELKKQRETEKLALIQQRRDQALLSTYAAEADLDTARDRAVGEVERGIKQAQDKLDLFLKEQQKLTAEMAANKGKEQPQELREQVSRNKLEIKTQQEAVASKKQEIEQIKAKFEADRVRLRELRGGKPADTPAAEP